MKNKSTGLMATRMTAEQVKAHPAREYNPQVWEERVDRMTSKYSDVEFYLADKSEHFTYDRFFAIYTLPEGLRLMNTFSYSGGITSGGFYKLMAYILELNADKSGLTFYPESRVRLECSKTAYRKDDGTIDYGVIDTTPSARKWMAEQSSQCGDIFTKEWVG